MIQDPTARQEMKTAGSPPLKKSPKKDQHVLDSQLSESVICAYHPV